MTLSHRLLYRHVLPTLAALALAWPSLHAAAQSTPADPRGRWITANGNLEVEVAPCGAALCGVVTQVLGNRSMSGAGEMKAADGRPALGLRLLHGFVPEGSDPKAVPTRWTGEIYNRENGKTYACDMSVDSAGNPAGELLLRGYVGLRLFGQTQRWQRAPAATPDPTPSAAPTSSPLTLR